MPINPIDYEREALRRTLHDAVKLADDACAAADNADPEKEWIETESVIKDMLLILAIDSLAKENRKLANLIKVSAEEYKAKQGDTRG